MWDCIAALPEPKDYLQVFRLSSFNGMQKIVHTQEEPKYEKEYLVNFNQTVNAKIFVIDDEDHCTMLLAEEY
jgi:hypothetical protein